MNILAIETSCDDTAVAILEKKGKKIKILSNIISSQVKLHAQYGGVYPFMAKREHQKNLPLVFEKALRLASLTPFEGLSRPLRASRRQGKLSKIDVIAVTVGPGLEPCLWVGINFANDLAKKLNAPLFPINHVEAHILANFVGKSQIPNSKFQKLFPAVCLVVSGGHTQLILMKKFLDYQVLGETRDDAAGECFDKVARILGLGYPGGPAIAAETTKLKTKNFKLKTNLPRPMINQKNYDFSFSGLKTAVLYEFRKQTPETQKSKRYIQAMCAEVQQAIIDVLLYKTLRAAKQYEAKSIILGGGVVANQELRKQFELKIKNCKLKTDLWVPPPKMCTDNAAMTAIAAYFHLAKGEKPKQKIEADANLRL